MKSSLTVAQGLFHRVVVSHDLAHVSEYGYTEDYVCLDCRTMSLCAVPHWTSEAMSKEKTDAVQAEVENFPSGMLY